MTFFILLESSYCFMNCYYYVLFKILKRFKALRRIISVLLAEGPHPFPFRIRKLSPPASMVLTGQLVGRVDQCRVNLSRQKYNFWRDFFIRIRRRIDCISLCGLGSYRIRRSRRAHNAGFAYIFYYLRRACYLI